jgi:hypothetical protein
VVERIVPPSWYGIGFTQVGCFKRFAELEIPAELQAPLLEEWDGGIFQVSCNAFHYSFLELPFEDGSNDDAWLEAR